MLDMAEQARLQNVFSLGFSSHGPLPFETPWSMKKKDFADYIGEIENLQSRFKTMEIYKGLEGDFIPGVVTPNDFRKDLDYTVGSIHFVEALPDGKRWEIDGPHHLFLEGYRHIFKGNIRDVVARYLELTREMIATSTPDILGHFDKIKIQNTDTTLFHESESWYRDEIMKTVNTISDAGIIVEVNTRGIYKKKSGTTYPSPWILEKLLEKNIPITLSSDAHHADDLIKQFEETAVILLRIGFKNLSILKEGSWKQHPFSTHGIVV